MRPLPPLLALPLAALLALLLWLLAARPVTLEVEWHGPLASASFAPFRDGQSPLARVYPSREQIGEDLARLAGVFAGVRTYTSREGMDAVPELAAGHGLTVTHGAWLGRDPAINAAEVQALIEAAGRHPDTIKRVIVGNEVLLRRDLPVEQLIDHLDRVRAEVEQPVSYADVWAFWLKNPQLAEHVDYITIHVLPYWEDEPAAVGDAERHIVAILDTVRAAFPGKPILIGEAGWPSEGRNRGPAVASLPEAARFNRWLPQFAARHGVDYNVVEAFDQPWKAQLEGTVGARWGVLDSARRVKYGFHGPVPAFADARLRAGSAIVLGALLAVAVLRALTLPFGQAFACALLAQALAFGAVELAYTAWTRAYVPTALTWTAQKLLYLGADAGLFAPATVARGWQVLADSAAALAWAWTWARIGAAAVALVLAGLAMRATLARRMAPGRALGLGYRVYCAGALAISAMLACAGRYLDIPLADFWLPVSAVLGFAALRRVARGEGWLEASRLGALFEGDSPQPPRPTLMHRWLALAAVAVLAGEAWALAAGEDFVRAHPDWAERWPLLLEATIANRELLGWAAMLLVLAWPYWTERRAARGR